MLVLASASPRRQEILHRAEIPFSVRPADVDESGLEGETPLDHVQRLAEAKARAVWREGELVLGADTVVAADGVALGKPRDREDAARMLTLLSGCTHDVLTGICLLESDQCRVAVEQTNVQFRAISEQEIETYVSSGEPLDKAGAYAIQGVAREFVERIEGCYFSVVGLPVARVYHMLRPAPGPRAERLLGAGTRLPKRPPNLPDDIQEHESPRQYVKRMAERAARAARAGPGNIALGAAKVISVDGILLGKPRDSGEAELMLRTLSGRKHDVLTAECRIGPTGSRTTVEETSVQLLKLGEDEIRGYVATGEPLAHFGAYSIEGVASKYIERIEGRFENIDGFPALL